MIELKIQIIELLVNAKLTPPEIAELIDVDEEFVELVQIEINN